MGASRKLSLLVLGLALALAPGCMVITAPEDEAGFCGERCWRERDLKQVRERQPEQKAARPEDRRPERKAVQSEDRRPERKAVRPESRPEEQGEERARKRKVAE